MQLVTLSSRPAIVDDGVAFQRLLTSLSTEFASLGLEQLPRTLESALEHTCVAMRVDCGTIIEFDEHGAVQSSHSRYRPDSEERHFEVELAGWQWLTSRLVDRQVIAISRLEDLPADAHGARDYARRSGLSSMLAVPVAIGERSVCALVIRGIL